MELEGDVYIAQKLLWLKERADTKSVEFNLSLASIRNLVRAKHCFYTGNLLTEETNHPLQRTIDRVNCQRGYVKGNVVACARFFNEKKGNLTIKEIAMLARKVK